MLRERGIVLEVCVSSNLNTRVVRSFAEMRELLRRLVEHDVRIALSTDGPEMLQAYLRDEIATVLRHDILTFDEVCKALDTAREATFVDRAPLPGGLRSGPGRRRNQGAAIAVEVEV